MQRVLLGQLVMLYGCGWMKHVSACFVLSAAISRLTDSLKNSGLRLWVRRGQLLSCIVFFWHVTDNNPGFSDAAGHFTQVSLQQHFNLGKKWPRYHDWIFLGGLEGHNAGWLRHGKLSCWYNISRRPLPVHCLSVYSSWKRWGPIRVSTFM